MTVILPSNKFSRFPMVVLMCFLSTKILSINGKVLGKVVLSKTTFHYPNQFSIKLIHLVFKPRFNIKKILEILQLFSSWRTTLNRQICFCTVGERTKLCSRYIDQPANICPVSRKTQLQWSSVLIFDLGVYVSRSRMYHQKNIHCIVHQMSDHGVYKLHTVLNVETKGTSNYNDYRSYFI